MRVRSFLRDRRDAAGLSIGQVVELTGLARGEVSMFERGHSIPRDDQLDKMRTVYGDPADWYPVTVLEVLALDIAECPGCGKELDPSASRRSVYHGERCRSRHRRRLATAAPTGT